MIPPNKLSIFFSPLLLAMTDPHSVPAKNHIQFTQSPPKALQYSYDSPSLAVNFL